jgi:hypothetical protein
VNVACPQQLDHEPASLAAGASPERYLLMAQRRLSVGNVDATLAEMGH